MPREFPKASRLGFGCASLGSRIGPREGLNALARAYELGINWFDLAPSYGDGEAEEIFSEFSKGRRTGIHICTKCGIQAGRVGRLRRLAKPIAQSAVRALPQLRQVASGRRQGASSVPLSGALIRESLDRSLRRLGTDHVEVYALHDPVADDLAREDVHRALLDVRASGKATIVGVAGNFEAAVAAWCMKPPVEFVQLGDPPFEGILESLQATVAPGWPRLLSTHSIFGRFDAVAMLSARAGSQDRLRALLVELGYAMPLKDAVRAALLDHALARNSDGIVIASMFSADHLEQNAARLGQAKIGCVENLFRKLAGNVAADKLHA